MQLYQTFKPLPLGICNVEKSNSKALEVDSAEKEVIGDLAAKCSVNIGDLSKSIFQ